MKLKELLKVVEISDCEIVHILDKNNEIIKVINNDNRDNEIDEYYLNCDVINAHPAFSFCRSKTALIDPETIILITRINIDFAVTSIKPSIPKKKSMTVKDLFNKLIDKYFDGNTTIQLTIFNINTKNPLLGTVISKDTFRPDNVKGSFQYLATISYFSNTNVKVYSITKNKDFNSIDICMEVDYDYNK